MHHITHELNQRMRQIDVIIRTAPIFVVVVVTTLLTTVSAFLPKLNSIKLKDLTNRLSRNLSFEEKGTNSFCCCNYNKRTRRGDKIYINMSQGIDEQREKVSINLMSKCEMTFSPAY